MKFLRFTWLGCVVLLGIFLLSGCANLHLSGGKLYFAQKNFDKAIRELELAAKEMPKRGDVHMHLAMAYAEVDRTVDAGREFSEALKLFKNGTKPYKDCKDNQRHYWADHFNEGLQLKDEERFDEAIAEFQKAIDIDPTEPAGYINRGYSLSVLKRLDDAIKSFKKATEVAPGDERAKTNLVSAYIDISRSQLIEKNFDDAIVYAEEAMKLNPDTKLKYQALDVAASAYFSKASAETSEAVQNEYFERAGDTYASMVEIAPADTAVLFNTGVAYLQMKNYTKSLTYLERLAEVTPKSKETLRILGRAVRESGDLDKAISVFKRLIDIDPREPLSHKYLASAYVAKGERDLGPMHFVIATALAEGTKVTDTQDRMKKLKTDYPKTAQIVTAPQKLGPPDEIYTYADTQSQVKIELWFYWKEGKAQPFISGKQGAAISFASQEMEFLIKVSGTLALKFTGSILTVGSGGDSVSTTVEGIVPQEFPVAGQVVSCSFQKQSEAGSLVVHVLRFGELVSQSETSAAYGVVSVSIK